MARARASRLSAAKILRQLREAGRRGDRPSLTLAVDQMRTLALSPRYWEKYLTLLRHPLARLVDLLVIKQGERIAHQKGWKKPGGGLRAPGGGRRPSSSSKGATSQARPQGATAPSEPKRVRRQSRRSKEQPSTRQRAETVEQPSLFEL